MRVLGIDPGSIATGFALLDAEGGRIRVETSGTLSFAKGSALPSRLSTLRERLGRLLGTLRPDVAAVEDVFSAAGRRSSLKLAHARGVILEALSTGGIEVFEYTPQQVKKAVGGYGLSDKESLRHLLCTLLDVRDSTLSSDASDAIAVALCHVQAAPFTAAVRAADEATTANRSTRPRSSRRREGLVRS